MEEKECLNAGKSEYLACEHKAIYILLMISAGMMGAYTFNMRGGVFCNGQTANIVMMAVSLGNGNLKKGLYYLIPIFAYMLGAFVSEILPSPIKKFKILRWDTCLIAIEMAVLFTVGFMPLTLPHQIVQVIVNFIASMQYNTFRQAEGVPMATTFCTNHVRQIGVAFAKIIRKGDADAKKRGAMHIEMIMSFMAGATLVTIFCKFMLEKSIWLVLIPLGIVLLQLMYADLVVEHTVLDQKPHGH